MVPAKGNPMASTSKAGSVSARRAAMACVVLIGATLATLSPAAAQQPAPTTPPGYCGPVTGLATTWLVEAIDNQTFNQQVADGQAAFDAAYASFSPDDPEPGILQEGLSAYPSVIAPLTDAVAAAGGDYLGVPQATRTQYYQDIAAYMNRLLEYIEPYCSPPTPVGALIEPCEFGPVTLGPLVGVITMGQPVEVTIGGDVTTVGGAVVSDSRTPPDEVVYLQAPDGTTPADVLLDGQANLVVAEISCADVTAGIDQSDFTGLLSASLVGDCVTGLGPLVLSAKESLTDALGVDPFNGGVGAPFVLDVEINGTVQPIVLPGPVTLPVAEDGATPTVTVAGQPIDVDAPSCDDPPSSNAGAPSDSDGTPAVVATTASPLSPRFTG